MIKLKKDFLCLLRSRENIYEDLLVFPAQLYTDLTDSASFVGGGIASSSQSLSIITAKEYVYLPYAHTVNIDNRRYVITAVTPIFRRRLGGISKKVKKYYILTLE
jgi:hypothetical protein